MRHTIGLKDAIIMEDDMQIDYIDKWENTIPEIVENAPEDVECIQLHCVNGRLLKGYYKVMDYSIRG